MIRKVSLSIIIIAFLLTACTNTPDSSDCGDNWNSYLHDDMNTGVTNDSLPFPLHKTWMRELQNPPQPAWPAPAKQDYYNAKRTLEPLVTYDRAFQPVVNNKLLYIASSANNSVSCYNSENGKIVWRFYTDAPNRVAPLWYKEKLFFGSDDGFVYCLNAVDGKLLWKRDFGINRKLIGNGRVISSVPVRTGIVARGDTVFIAAGLLPEEHVSIHACNAYSGDDYWRRDLTDLAPQGYPVMVDSLWYIPNSRVQPMAFSVKDGRLSRTLKGLGGDNLSFIDGRMIFGVDWNGELNAKRLLESEITGYKVTGMNNRMYVASNFSITAIDVKDYASRFKQQRMFEKEIKLIVADVNKNELKGIGRLDSLRHALEEVKNSEYLWQSESDKSYSIINTSNAIVSGQQDRVVAYDPETGNLLWSENVNGRAYGMAVCGRKLYVSTDKGFLYCFGEDDTQTDIVDAVENSELKRKEKFKNGNKVARIARNCTRPNGVLLLLNSSSVSLIGGLNVATGYTVIATNSSDKVVEKCRRSLDKAGVYGVRTTLYTGDISTLNFSDYMFNVIVVDKDFNSDNKDELFRILAPAGGRLLINKRDNSNLSDLLLKAYPEELKLVEDDYYFVLERSPLPGSGEWTNLYANSANTASTGDKYASDKFKPLWFGQPGPRDMSDRHHRAPSPLYKDGILFVTLDMGLLAADAYNGSLLWKRDIPHFRRIKISRDAGNVTLDSESVYAVADNFCHVLNRETGVERALLRVPQVGMWPDDAHWGYVALSGNSIIGSGRKSIAIFNKYSRLDWSELSRLVTSGYLFSVNKNSGKKQWIYKGGVILNPSICIGDGKLFFVESYSPEAVNDDDGLITFNELKKDLKLVAVDVNTGEVVWRKPYYFKTIEHILYGSYTDGVYLLSGSGNVKGSLWYGNYAFNAYSGSEMWQQEKRYLTWTNGSHGEQIHRAVIMGGTVYSEPFAFDLKTGEMKKGWVLRRGGHACGTISGAEDALFFRADNPAVCVPSQTNRGEKLNNVTRPGCWINMLPAGGLLMIPEASSGCSCNFPLQMTIVYQPTAPSDSPAAAGEVGRGYKTGE